MDQQQQQLQLKLEEYRPCTQQDKEYDNSLRGADPMTIDQCETIREMDDSQLVGTSTAVAAHTRDVSMVDVEVRTVATVAVADMSTIKRKRGRPPRIQGKTGPPSLSQRKKKDEEDVCFICFDGGSLVLCDRRGCPKAYHPACIKRDESFFRSKAKWNCGWHICSSCQKASHYMCYTCTYSLCNACTKDADYVCVRGNKGFCGTCMRTIMLIENIWLANTEMVQVDFDDKTSWEYLFKVYWVYLKAKLSLTIDELTRAKNPWKGDELPKTKNSWKGAGIVVPKESSSGEIYRDHDEKSSCLDNCYGNVEANHSKKRKTKDQPNLLNENHSLVLDKSGSDKVTPLLEGTTWATKELLEFVAHMKNGDISMLSQFDVQGLLLEYVKRNNLCDPHKSQIVCDSRLLTLFGKPCVGHLEMLKLLECHFLIKEESSADDAVKVGVADAVGGQLEAAGSTDGQLIASNDRCKTHKKMDERGPQIYPNPDEYAAIDVHNINLLYLKRNLMENLMDDFEKFHERVVGSFVRIRILGGDQKQDMHRLVQVVGTSKVAESYKVGSRTTDIMLEILNLDKKEVISIDEISNQEFSEDECRHLRQSIKCGLIKHLKVGEIQEKAMALQPFKWLEAEISQFNPLHDQAIEKGHGKELRECVEKLVLLKSPKERECRRLEIPNIHTDPNMDPSRESEEGAGGSHEKEQGNHLRPRLTGVDRKAAELNSSLREVDGHGVGNSAEKNLATACERNRNMCTFYVDRDGSAWVHERVDKSTWSQGGGAYGLNSLNTSGNHLGATGSAAGDWNSQSAVQSDSLPAVASAVIPSPLSSGRELSVTDFETEKLWHYQDPLGKVQGPFSMIHLRKWNTSGLFPSDLRVWRINEKQDDSILLTDALVGQLPKESLQHCNRYLLPQEATVTSNDAGKKWEHGLSLSTDATWVDGKGVDHGQRPVQNAVSVNAKGDNELLSSNELGSHSSTWTKAVDVAITNDAQAQSSLQGWELSEGGKSLASLSPSSSEKLFGSLLLQLREGHVDEKWSSNPRNADRNSHRAAEGKTNIKESDEKFERADSEGHSSQSSGQNWGSQPINSSSSGWDSNSGFVSVSKSTEKSEQNQEIGFSDLLSRTPKHSDGDSKGQPANNKLSACSNVPAQDSGPSWSTASSLVVGGGQLPEVAGNWGSYSPTPAKPSVEEWDSNVVNASSRKPTEGASDHAATPTSGTDQLTHSSPTHPAIDVSSWQPIVPEPNEFCSLVDESVSDLLAEVEAMESLGGLPSPTSKMSCGRELTQGSDDDCFSPVAPFSPAPDPGKSDALSSTGDVQMPSQLTASDEPLRLSHMPSQPTITNKLHAVSQIPSPLTVTDKPHQLSQMPLHSIIPDEHYKASPMPSQSTLTEEPLGLWQTDVLDPQKSSSSAEVEGDTKPSDVSVNQRKTRSEIEPLASSTVNQGDEGSDIRAPTSSTVSQMETGSNTRRANLNRGAPQGNASMAWGTGHGSVQQRTNSTPAVSTGNVGVGSWGSQPRNGGDNRYSSPRDHRSYHFQGRESGFGRDRCSWNRQPTYGFGNGGSSKPQGKGQRVCKFYESGYCKKGASCSYWHP
ncbi:zinc finger CCCH domain-containing protein 44 isoform X2 [Hevea brasiliensis]|uniref:zinc finger CCCH domain-containing protein 44 isoform X2 n=1 Tax=Hevea brasiliensis TaxID=3981 RepID=UPI0025CDD744|nr:zinc finger CCCH domain-containing protein 44 isoform X2 [Hevea brasiliensis]